MPRGDSYQLQGQQGGNVFDSSNGGGVDGSWRTIVAIEDSELNLSLDNISNPVGVTFSMPAGTVFLGSINYISLNSGVVVAYLND